MAQHKVELRPQPWDWPGPRVLLEQPYGADSTERVDALRRAGFAVSVCPGPTADDRCPLAGDEGCAAAHGADIVVSSLDLETAEAREALAALHARLPRLPVLVEAAAKTAARWPDLVPADALLEPGISADALVERVRSTLQGRWRALA
jgi:DNA-binding NarL/FixJ family response regulator